MTKDYHQLIFEDFLKYVPSFLDKKFLFNKKVLVVGCGDGGDCSYFINQGARKVHGLDISEQIGVNFKHPRVQYFQDSAEAMGFEDNTYDYVYSLASMEHIHNIDKAFNEMVRVARVKGLVYCFAAPLWNSREGHHKFDLFKEFPWIHLRLSQEQILEYCYENDIKSQSLDIDIGCEVEFMFSEYMNCLPSHRYVDVCNQLKVSKIIQNTLWQESDEYLTIDIAHELSNLGYSPHELLTVSHTFVAEK